MATEQRKDTPAGKVPALNIERIYSTTVPADELARALADHFRGQEFETQVFHTSGDRTVVQARKESLWRNLLGVAYALTVVLTPSSHAVFASWRYHRPGAALPTAVRRLRASHGTAAAGTPVRSSITCQTSWSSWFSFQMP